jgi:hypothetical protein
MKFLGMVPYRCQECNRRFFVPRYLDEKLLKNRRRDEERFAQMSAAAEIKTLV